MMKHVAIAVFGIALAGCAGSGDLMRSATPTVPLQFESDPPGAEVKTSGGQTCRTPCALAVPAADMQVTYSLNGYQPQTIPVKLMPPDGMMVGGEESGMASTSPRFSPSPVTAELVRAAPRRAPPKKARVAKQPAASADAAAAPAPPRRQAAPPPSDGGFAPPPSTSGFNPPPAQPQQAPGGAWPAPSQTR